MAKKMTPLERFAYANNSDNSTNITKDRTKNKYDTTDLWSAPLSSNNSTRYSSWGDNDINFDGEQISYTNTQDDPLASARNQEAYYTGALNDIGVEAKAPSILSKIGGVSKSVGSGALDLLTGVGNVLSSPFYGLLGGFEALTKKDVANKPQGLIEQKENETPMETQNRLNTNQELWDKQKSIGSDLSTFAKGGAESFKDALLSAGDPFFGTKYRDKTVSAINFNKNAREDKYGNEFKNAIGFLDKNPLGEFGTDLGAEMLGGGIAGLNPTGAGNALVALKNADKISDISKYTQGTENAIKARNIVDSSVAGKLEQALADNAKLPIAKQIDEDIIKAIHNSDVEKSIPFLQNKTDKLLGGLGDYKGLGLNGLNILSKDKLLEIGAKGGMAKYATMAGIGLLNPLAIPYGAIKGSRLSNVLPGGLGAIAKNVEDGLEDMFSFGKNQEAFKNAIKNPEDAMRYVASAMKNNELGISKMAGANAITKEVNELNNIAKENGIDVDELSDVIEKPWKTTTTETIVNESVDNATYKSKLFEMSQGEITKLQEQLDGAVESLNINGKDYKASSILSLKLKYADLQNKLNMAKNFTNTATISMEKQALSQGITKEAYSQIPDELKQLAKLNKINSDALATKLEAQMGISKEEANTLSTKLLLSRDGANQALESISPGLSHNLKGQESLTLGDIKGEGKVNNSIDVSQEPFFNTSKGKVGSNDLREMKLKDYEDMGLQVSDAQKLEVDGFGAVEHQRMIEAKQKFREQSMKESNSTDFFKNNAALRLVMGSKKSVPIKDDMFRLADEFNKAFGKSNPWLGNANKIANNLSHLTDEELSIVKKHISNTKIKGLQSKAITETRILKDSQSTVASRNNITKQNAINNSETAISKNDYIVNNEAYNAKKTTGYDGTNVEEEALANKSERTYLDHVKDKMYKNLGVDKKDINNALVKKINTIEQSIKSLKDNDPYLYDKLSKELKINETFNLANLTKENIEAISKSGDLAYKSSKTINSLKTMEKGELRTALIEASKSENVFRNSPVEQEFYKSEILKMADSLKGAKNVSYHVDKELNKTVEETINKIKNSKTFPTTSIGFSETKKAIQKRIDELYSMLPKNPVKKLTTTGTKTYKTNEESNVFLKFLNENGKTNINDSLSPSKLKALGIDSLSEELKNIKGTELYLTKQIGAEGFNVNGKSVIDVNSSNKVQTMIHEIMHSVSDKSSKARVDKVATNIGNWLTNMSEDTTKAIRKVIDSATVNKSGSFSDGSLTSYIDYAKNIDKSVNANKETISEFASLFLHPNPKVRGDFLKHIPDEVANDFYDLFSNIEKGSLSKMFPKAPKNLIDEYTVKINRLKPLVDAINDVKLPIEEQLAKLKAININNNESVESLEKIIAKETSGIKSFDKYGKEVSYKLEGDNLIVNGKSIPKTVTRERVTENIVSTPREDSLPTGGKGILGKIKSGLKDMANKEKLKANDHYVPHTMNPIHKGNAEATRIFNKMFPSIDDPTSVYHKQRKYTGSIKEINNMLFKSTGVKDLLDTNIIRSYANRALASNKFLHEKEFSEFFHNNFAERVMNKYGFNKMSTQEMAEFARKTGFEPIEAEIPAEFKAKGYKTTKTTDKVDKEFRVYSGNEDDFTYEVTGKTSDKPVEKDVLKSMLADEMKNGKGKNVEAEQRAMYWNGYAKYVEDKLANGFSYNKKNVGQEIINTKTVSLEDYEKGINGSKVKVATDTLGAKPTNQGKVTYADGAEIPSSRDSVDFDNTHTNDGFDDIRNSDLQTPYVALDASKFRDTETINDLTETYLIHNDAMNYFTKTREAQYQYDKNMLLKYADKFTKMFQSQATFSGSFHINNVIGNVFNSWNHVGSNIINPKYYKMVDDILKGKEGEINGIPYSQINKEAEALGLPQTSYEHEYSRLKDYSKGVVDELEKPKQSVFSKINPLNTDNIYYTASREKIGVPIERSAKMINFITHLENGKSFKEAGELTNHALFDYGDLTDFEQGVMKRVVPFYTFMRKNLPLQIEEMADKTTPYKFVSNLAKASQNRETDKEKAMRPDYMENYFALGNGKYLNLNLPVNDLSRAGDITGLASAVNPLIKTPIEMLMNRQLFNDSKISKTGDKADYIKYGIQSNAPIIKLGQNIFNSILGTDEEKELSGEKLLKFIGKKTTGYDMSQAEKQSLYKYVEELRNQYYNEIEKNPQLKQLAEQAKLKRANTSRSKNSTPLSRFAEANR